jgi:hypothetical protein
MANDFFEGGGVRMGLINRKTTRNLRDYGTVERIPFLIFRVTKSVILQNESLYLIENKKARV